MRGLVLLILIVALVTWSCAERAKSLGTPQSSSHVVPQHTEVCVAVSEEEIASLVDDRWINSLKTGDAHKVVSTNYAEKSVLLPTMSSKPRFTASEKEDYFNHFLENRPVGRVESRTIELDCNTAIDDGFYTFTFQKTGVTVKGRYTFTYKWDGRQWLIMSHHSSMLPAEAAAPEEPVHAVAQHTETCVAASEEEIAALFDRWNNSLKTGDAHKVVANYGAKSVLLPLDSTKPRLTLDDKEEYFHHFLRDKPVGRVESRTIELDCNTAVDDGLYTFTFEKTGAQARARYTFTYKWDGRQWLITSHHSSALPAEAAAPVEPVHAVAQHTETCVAASEEEIAALFDRWNDSLKTGDARTVVSVNYAAGSIFLPIMSSKPRLTLDDKEEYFHHFLRDKPVARIESRTIELDCNTAIDDGLYTFTFQKSGATIKGRYTIIYKWDGTRWLITSHHASALPVEAAAPEGPVHAVAQHTETCVAASEEEIAALFDRWNNSLKTGDAHKVVANYAAKSVFLPLDSTKPRLTLDDKEEYFHHFLRDKPVGRIESRTIELDCNTAVDDGLYTFMFERTGSQVKARYTFTYKWDGSEWLITSHHSSALPAGD